MSLASSWTGARPRSHPCSLVYRCEVAWDYASVAASWAQMAAHGSALAFQQATWLTSWYATLGKSPNLTPLFVTVVDAEAGRDVMGLPLVLRHDDGLRMIEFADGGLTDYNAPVLAADCRFDQAQARAIWTAISRVLPPADLFVAPKMPMQVAGQTNPLARLAAAVPCRLSGNVLSMPERYDDWHDGLERPFRKELERSLRVFLRNPGATFRRIEEPAEVARIYAELKRMQAARIQELGLSYDLDEPGNEAFYDGLVSNGIANGSTILTALTTDTELVAALFGVRAGKHYAMVRLATADGKWRNCSPGRLVIERTMKLLHGDGVRCVDFTIGDYAYKRRLGATTVPLVELYVPLSWRGIVPAMRGRLRGMLRNAPIARKLKQLLHS